MPTSQHDQAKIQSGRTALALAAVGTLAFTGCAFVGTGPAISWLTQPALQSQALPGGALSVSLTVNGHELTTHAYRTQYLMSDVQDFAIGLFNASTSTERGNLGYEYWNNGGNLATTSIAFGTQANCTAAADTGTIPIFLGTMSGCSSVGLMSNTGGGYLNGLTTAQYRDSSRWLLVRRNAALDNLTKSTTFSNLAPGSRYYLFAEAFLKNVPDGTNATESDIAGIATQSVVVSPNTTTSATLPLTLNFNEGGLGATVNTTPASPSATGV